MVLSTLQATSDYSKDVRTVRHIQLFQNIKVSVKYCSRWSSTLPRNLRIAILE